MTEQRCKPESGILFVGDLMTRKVQNRAKKIKSGESQKTEHEKNRKVKIIQCLFQSSSELSQGRKFGQLHAGEGRLASVRRISSELGLRKHVSLEVPPLARERVRQITSGFERYLEETKGDPLWSCARKIAKLSDERTFK